MGQPALKVIYPAEEAIADAAVKRTTKLVVIQGGKGAATATAGELLAKEAGLITAGRGALAALAAPIAAFLTGITWSSDLNSDEDEWLATHRADDKKASTNQSADPKANTEEANQQCPKDFTCPPHDWVLKEAPTLEEALADLQTQIDGLKNSPSEAKKLRGIQFERDALEINSKIKPVKSANTIYICRRCKTGDGPTTQELDIVFDDGQIAESKSRNAKQNKKGGDQAVKELDLQALFNCKNGTNLKPLAKLDNNLPDIDKSVEIFKRRGYEIERLNTTVKD